MNKLINISFFLILLFSIQLLHSSVSSLSLNPNYQKRDYRGLSCAVIVSGKIVVDYEGDVTNEFGNGDKDDLIRNYYLTNFPNYLQNNSLFSEVYKDSCITPFKTREYAIIDNSSERRVMHIPLNNQIIAFVKGAPDYILFIEKVRIISKFIPPIGIVASGPCKPIIIKSQYLLWDNRKGFVAGKGYGKTTEYTGTFVNMETWKKVMHENTSDIVGNTRVAYPKIRKVKFNTLTSKEIPANYSMIYWKYQSPDSINSPLMIQSSDQKELLLKINNELFTLTNQDDTLKTTVSSKKDSIVQNFRYKYIRLRMVKRLLAKDVKDENGILCDKYQAALHMRIAKKRKLLFFRGKTKH